MAYPKPAYHAQPRVISIALPEIPCWWLVAVVRHLCMHSRYAVRAAGFQSNDKSLARRNSSDHSNDSVETIIAFGIARRNLKCLTWSVHQARVMISSSYIRPCAPRTPAPHPDRALFVLCCSLCKPYKHDYKQLLI